MNSRSGTVPPAAAKKVREAQHAIEDGDLFAAARRLEAAASIHDVAGDTEGKALLLLQASVLFRAVGRLPDAKHATTTAWNCASSHQLQHQVAAEMGEIARVEGDWTTAEVWLSRAIELSAPTGEARGLLLGKLSEVHAATGDYRSAVESSQSAGALLRAGGLHNAAFWADLQRIGALIEAGDRTQAASDLKRLLSNAARDDHGVRAEAHLVELALTLKTGLDPMAAIRAASAARQEALAAGAPAPYTAAATALARLHDATGGRLAAYESLAVAWVTLAELIGREAARAAIEPSLLDLRDRWGDDDFATVKLAYEDQRRSALNQRN